MQVVGLEECSCRVNASRALTLFVFPSASWVVAPAITSLTLLLV